MIITEVFSNKANRAYLAKVDAEQRTAENAKLYSDVQKADAINLKLDLTKVYNHRNIYINYREKFIAVKIDRASIADGKGLRKLEQTLEKRKSPVTKVITKNGGVIYRMHRQTV